jgi:RND family efflux transporter MFP subunit
MAIKIKNTKIAILILSLSLIIYFFLGKLKSEPEKNLIESKPPIVSSIILKKEEVQITIDSQGMVTPLIQTILSAEVSGTIVEISPKFVSGGFFRKGETLMVIDPSVYIVALKQAEALKDQRQNEFDDAVKIRKQGYLSESEYLSIVTALALAEAGLVNAQQNLDETKIQLPYDGMILEKSSDLGQSVSPGSRLGVTFAIDYAEVRLPISNSDLSFADLPTLSEISETGEAQGSRVVFEIKQSRQLQAREGYIVRSEGVVDEKTRMTYAVARIKDPYNLGGNPNINSLPMGSFVNAKIYTSQNYQFIKIPRSAIINNRQIILIDDQKRIHYQDIELIRTDKNFGYVRNGIKEGQRISTTSLEDGINGMSVRLTQN